MARTFDGSDDHIITADGGAGDVSLGPRTFAAIVRRAANNVTHGIVQGENLAGTAQRTALYVSSANRLTVFSEGTGVTSTSFSVGTADGWVLVAGNKADATATPRIHKYVFSTGAWSHADCSATLVDSANACSTFKIGRRGTGDHWNGDMAVAGVWLRELSDAEFEILPYALANWLSLRPNALWMFDQASEADPLLDITGSDSDHADQTSRTGTTVATSSVPVFNRHGWVLPVTREAGAADATVTPAVIACTTALPKSAVGTGAAPAAIAAATALPQPGVGVGAAPAALAAVTTLPQATPDGGATDATTTPGAIAAVAALPAAAVGVGAAPAPIAALVALPQAGVGVGVTLAVLAAITTLPQAGVGVGAAPAVLTAVVVLPQPGVGVGAAPDVIPAVVTLPQVGVGVGATSVVLAAVTGLPQPAVGVGVTPAAVAAVVAMPAATVVIVAAVNAGTGTVVLSRAATATGTVTIDQAASGEVIYGP